MNGKIRLLAENSGIYGLGTILNRFIGLLLLPFFTSYLSPSDYGILALLGLLSQTAQPIFSLGLGGGLGPCYFEGSNENRKCSSVWTSFFLLLASNFCLVALGWGFSSHLSVFLFNSTEYSEFVWLFLAAVAIQNLCIPFMLRAQFENRAVPFVIISTTIVLVSIFFNVFFVIYKGIGVKGMILGQMVSSSVGALLYIIYVSRWTKFLFSKDLAKELLALGAPLIPSFAFIFVLMQGNRYILQHYSGLESVGIYSVGFNFGMVMNIVVGAFISAWYPYFMSFMENKEEAKVLFGKIFTYYLYSAGGLALLCFVFARPVVFFMTQPNFHAAFEVVGLVATAQFLQGLFSLLLPGIYFAKEVRYVPFIQAPSAVLLLVVSFFLIPKFGSFGAAISLVLGVLSMAVMMGLWNHFRRNVYFNANYEIGRILSFALFYFVFSVLTLIPHNFAYEFQLVVAPLGALVVFSAIFFMLTGTEKEAVQLFVKGKLRWRRKN